ncbi:MAG: hypothetical protein B7Z37_13385 [Verrucomicrobia bacterium 12-59-8]|nr:MAG: hypothetical protein B7Z37_13385 [Verrucomicrobia bacterium 12-59-8]
MIRNSGCRRYRKSDQHPAKGVVLVASELGRGFAGMRENHAHVPLIGNTHFDRMTTIDQCRRHANGWRDPMRRKQPAKQQQQMHQPA